MSANTRKPVLCISIFIVACGCSAALVAAEPAFRRGVISVDLPNVPPVELQLIAKLGPGPAKENSGIVKSRNHPDLFWIHNDSGDEPRIYPIHRDGTNYGNKRYPHENGVLIGGAINVDWEDITSLPDGTLVIADVGNNANDRRDLTLYLVDEPAPTAGRTTFRKKLFVGYPEQQDFPASREDFNYDCEALFTVGETIYLFTKNRSDSYSSLYSLTDPQSEIVNQLEYCGTFDIRGQAVAADCTSDGKRLVVLTYTGIWLFERDTVEQNFFEQHVRWAPLAPHEAEAVCFADDETVLIADEATAELFELNLNELAVVD